VKAGSAAARRVGELMAVHVIARPSDQMSTILSDRSDRFTSAPLPAPAETNFENHFPRSVRESGNLTESLLSESMADSNAASEPLQRPNGTHEGVLPYDKKKASHQFSPLEVADMKVAQLRALLSKHPYADLPRQEIKYANKKELLIAFERAYQAQSRHSKFE
jgi:hypothetical protein